MTTTESLMQRIRALKDGPFDANGYETEHLTFGQRVADNVAIVIGSWSFIIGQALILAGWIYLNSNAWFLYKWDLRPYILLNLILSFQAAFASPVIMMSQNRQAAKDRLLAESAYRINCQMERVMHLLVEHIELQHRAMIDKLNQIEGEEREELAMMRDLKKEIDDADF